MTSSLRPFRLPSLIQAKPGLLPRSVLADRRETPRTHASPTTRSCSVIVPHLLPEKISLLIGRVRNGWAAGAWVSRL